MDEIKTPKKEKGASWGECTHHDCGKKCTYIDPTHNSKAGIEISGVGVPNKSVCIEPTHIVGISSAGGGININKKNKNKNKQGVVKERSTRYMILDSIFDDWSISQKVYFCGCIQVNKSHNITKEDVRTYNKCQSHKDK